MKATKPRYRTFTANSGLNHDDLSSVRNRKTLGAKV
jgi:hypothetical protein